MLQLGFEVIFFSFVKKIGGELMQCLGRFVWNNFQNVQQTKLERYVFLHTFENIIFIALLMNVMFLESLNPCNCC